MNTTQLMNPMLRRLIRVESKLHNLMAYVGCPKDEGPESSSHTADEAEIMRHLVRIESKLQTLMKYEGVDPFTRK
jgi:ribosomal protein S15P/S13E